MPCREQWFLSAIKSESKNAGIGKPGYRLKVGKITVGLVCHVASFADFIREYFGPDFAAGEPDLRLKLEIVGHEGLSELPNNYFTSK